MAEVMRESVAAQTSGMSSVSNQLTSLATDIETTLNDIEKVVNVIAEGGIDGSAAETFINEYMNLQKTLITYPQRLAEMSDALAKTIEGYETINSAAEGAVTGA